MYLLILYHNTDPVLQIFTFSVVVLKYLCTVQVLEGFFTSLVQPWDSLNSVNVQYILLSSMGAPPTDQAEYIVLYLNIYIIHTYIFTFKIFQHICALYALGLVLERNYLFVVIRHRVGGFIITSLHPMSDKVVCICTIVAPRVCAMDNTVLVEATRR